MFLIAEAAGVSVPGVLDTDLAQALGMSRPRDIRKDLIIPNHEELENFGAVVSRANMNELSSFGDLSPRRGESTGGRPATAYYLNEAQALLVCTLSRTPIAKQVRAELIRGYWPDFRLLALRFILRHLESSGSGGWNVRANNQPLASSHGHRRSASSPVPWRQQAR